MTTRPGCTCRIAERTDEIRKAERIKDPEHRRLELERIGDVDLACVLGAPIGWPIVDENVPVSSGIPRLDLVMQVDLIGKFKYDKSLVSFQVRPVLASVSVSLLLQRTPSGAQCLHPLQAMGWHPACLRALTGKAPAEQLRGAAGEGNV